MRVSAGFPDIGEDLGWREGCCACVIVQAHEVLGCKVVESSLPLIEDVREKCTFIGSLLQYPLIDCCFYIVFLSKSTEIELFEKNQRTVSHNPS